MSWVRCAVCGGGWRHDYRGEVEEPPPSVTETYAGYLGKEEMFLAVAREKAAWVSKELGPGMSVIEVGPGLGAVAKCLLESRPETRYIAIEPNPLFQKALSGICHRVYQDGFMEAMEDALEDAADKGDPVLVYFDNVLEHMLQPLEVVSLVKELAPAGSKILVEVPNEFGLRYRYRLQDVLRGEKRPPTSPVHINLFTVKSLRTMFRSAGFAPDIWYHPIRFKAQVTYCMQRYPVPPLAAMAVLLLRLFPIDYLIGCPYWLRATAVVSAEGKSRK